MLIGETAIGEIPGIGDSFSVLSKSYAMDMWTIFAGSEPLEDPPGAIRYYNYRSYDILLKKLLTTSYNGLLAIARSDLSKNYQINTSLLKTLASADFDIILRPSRDSLIPSTSVIDAIVKSYAEILDAVWRQMETMTNALKLDYAWDEELDNAWGKIYDLPRISDEDDTSYRDRLKTRTNILNSSGTKANCESIIDNVIGEESTNVDPSWPANVKITFDTITAMRTAREKQNTLAILIPQMLAAGVSYDLMLPFIDLYFDIVMNGPIWLPYNNYLAIRHRNKDTTYECDLIEIFQNVCSTSDDITLQKYFQKTLLMGSLIRSYNNKNYSIYTGLFGTIVKNLLMDMITEKDDINVPYTTNGYVTKNDLEKSPTFDLISQITKRRIYHNDIMSVFHNSASIDFDIATRLYLASIDCDILNKQSFPKRSTMQITLVGA
ncbi:hypothetical protein [Bacteroides sp.]|uniref:hypothetical protein n=1 Tax=Bacteroides sp. TaxID=29523 RepID=UPI00263684D6|nr:hypothetical protein [Bacteroides sp.]MDD3040733.1 hypothetical protein [Bacteroides sp.]